MKATLFAKLTAARGAKRPCAVATDTESGAQAFVDATEATGDLVLSETELTEVRTRLAADRSGVNASGHFVRVYAAPARMIIVGAVHIAQALAPMARMTGFDVIVIDPRASFARAGELAGITSIVAWPDEAMADLRPDSRTAVVTLTHDSKLDDPALTAALRSDAFYIGALGSRKTHGKRLDRLKAAGFGDADLMRIHGPVGLDINALTPAEIAVAILAQAVAIARAPAV